MIYPKLTMSVLPKCPLCNNSLNYIKSYYSEIYKCDVGVYHCLNHINLVEVCFNLKTKSIIRYCYIFKSPQEEEEYIYYSDYIFNTSYIRLIRGSYQDKELFRVYYVLHIPPEKIVSKFPLLLALK